MIRKEALNLKVGDLVEITQHGLNRGKQGKITEFFVDLGGRARVYIRPTTSFSLPKVIPKWRIHGESVYFNYESFKLVTDDDHDKNHSLEIVISGDDESVEKTVHEILEIAKKIAPEAKVTIQRKPRRSTHG